MSCQSIAYFSVFKSSHYICTYGIVHTAIHKDIKAEWAKIKSVTFIADVDFCVTQNDFLFTTSWIARLSNSGHTTYGTRGCRGQRTRHSPCGDTKPNIYCNKDQHLGMQYNPGSWEPTSDVIRCKSHKLLQTYDWTTTETQRWDKDSGGGTKMISRSKLKNLFFDPLFYNKFLVGLW